jgi:hypothetical protein
MSEVMAETSHKAQIIAMFKAWNARDLDTVVTMMTPDFEYFTEGDERCSPQQLCAFARTIWEATPDEMVVLGTDRRRGRNRRHRSAHDRYASRRAALRRCGPAAERAQAGDQDRLLLHLQERDTASLDRICKLQGLGRADGRRRHDHGRPW